MKLEDGVYNAVLVTVGRKSGNPHAVELKAVHYNGKLYFSRRNPNSDWLKNAMINPLVKVKIDDNVLHGRASLVSDEELARKISSLKYSDKRSLDSRIVLEVILDE
jgi:hypothetical protein